MKKLLILFLLALQSLVAKPILAVSIPMQEEFIQKIAGMEYEIISLVEKGVNPHDFEPKFSSIKKVNEAIAYFSIGIEFEDSWLKRFKQQNPQMQIFPSNAGIDFINFAQNTHHHENHSHDNGDKHIWLSTSNARQIATNLYKALSTLNPQKDYSKAYEMTKTMKFLTKTQAYEKLENIWNRAFFNAKKLLIENAKINQRLAEQYLAPFENTPKKELIIQLLRNSDVFAKADNLIKQQNFKEYFSLTFQFSFLRETDLYKKVLLLGEKMLTNLIELEKNFQYQEAKKIAETLLVFPNLKRSANEKIVLMQQKENLLNAIEKKEVKKIYSMVDDIESLRSMPQFKDFTKDFLRRYEEAKPYAYAGNAKHTMVIFGEYMEISYWIDKIASLIKIAYLKQISNALNEIEVNWVITIKRYYERFGKSAEIIKLLQNHHSKEILDEFEGEGESDGYRYHPFVDNIVIYIVQKDSDFANA